MTKPQKYISTNTLNLQKWIPILNLPKIVQPITDLDFKRNGFKNIKSMDIFDTCRFLQERLYNIQLFYIFFVVMDIFYIF